MKHTLVFLTASLALLAQGGFSGPGRYEIYSPLSHKVLDMDRNDRRTVIQYEARHTDNQTWDFVDAGGGYYYIRNVMNGFALATIDDRNSSPLIAEPFSGSAQQQWRLENGDRSTGILVNRNGKAIDIPYGSTNNGTKINSYNRNSEANQRWTFQPVSGTFGSSGRYDRYETNRGRGRTDGGSRYDSLTPNSTGYTNQRNSDGVYFDDRDRMVKMDGDGVCFYRDRDYRGDAVCATVRSGRRQWNSNFSGVGSVKFFGRAGGVQVFDREDFRGNSVELTQDEPNLDQSRFNLRGTPQSMKVY